MRYGEYMDPFNAMVDGIQLQETRDLLRQWHARGWRSRNRHGHRPHCQQLRPGCSLPGRLPKHGSAPDGGSTDFLPWMLK